MAVSQVGFSKSFGEWYLIIRLTCDYNLQSHLLIDNTNPFGPCLVSNNAIPDPQNLRLKCTLNGNTVQDGTTA